MKVILLLGLCHSWNCGWNEKVLFLTHNSKPSIPLHLPIRMSMTAFSFHLAMCHQHQEWTKATSNCHSFPQINLWLLPFPNHRITYNALICHEESVIIKNLFLSHNHLVREKGSEVQNYSISKEWSWKQFNFNFEFGTTRSPTHRTVENAILMGDVALLDAAHLTTIDMHAFVWIS